MMEFLRGLAPRPEGDVTRAAAVVPSRFATGGPSGGPLLVSLTPTSADPDSSWLAPGDPHPHVVAHSAGESAARPGAAAIDAAAVTRVAGDPPPPADPSASARVAWRATPDDEGQAARPASPMLASRANGDVHAAPWKPSRPIGVEANGAPGRAVAGPALADRVESVAPPATIVAAPLSEAALRARDGSTPDRRPIIHVTIDRIDVRAAAPTPAAPPSPRSRAAPPRVSLADYLRGAGETPVSSPLAIGAVSAVLRNVLDNGIVEAAPLGTTVLVTAVAPDTIKLDAPEEPPQLNVFLHQVTPNSGWRNRELPSRATGGQRVANPPLALDLHYLITAYGRSDFQAEILLGYAMHLLHERPMLDRAAIRRALDPSPLDVSMLPPAFQALAASDLAEQVEAIRITPSVMSTEEISKLWAAIQSPYRPSAAYQVSVVLIDARRPAQSPLPVLSRGLVDPDTNRDRGVVVNADMLPPVPTLLRAAPAGGKTVARLGEPITVTGVRLTGTGATALLVHRLVSAPIQLPVTPDGAGKEFTLTLPNDAAAQSTFVPGLWQLSVRVTPPGEANPRETNGIGLLLAADPVIAEDTTLNLPAATAVRGETPPRVTVTMRSRPQVRVGQRATLALDGTPAEAAPRVAASDPLVFAFPNSVPDGDRWVRLRVDGVDSPLVLRSGPAPVFDPSQRLTVPS